MFVNGDVNFNGHLDASDVSLNILKANIIEDFRMDGHIIPTTNSVYDLGNAEYKIRHLFLSDNSLWIGDDHKLDISNGKLKLKKRNKSVVPTGIVNANGNRDAALQDAGVYNLEDMTLSNWEKYAKKLNVPFENIFNSNTNDFEIDKDLETSTSSQLSGDIISNLHVSSYLRIGTSEAMPGLPDGTEVSINAEGLLPELKENSGALEFYTRNLKRIEIKENGDVYVSEKLSKLRYSVPEFINSNQNLLSFVSAISKAKLEDGGDGAIIIKLKKL